MPKSFYIIDGHYQIFRAFYGLPQQLTSPTGEPTGATHVFCSMLFSLIKTRKPDYLAMVMDVSDETTFRRDLDPNYKAHRDAAPDGLLVQADRIVSIVQALGIPVFRVPGAEADDLMATIVEKLKDQDVEIFLVSRDKDLDQLLSDRVRLFDPVKQVVIDPQVLLETKGYTPQQAVEVQALIGDATDNIPGVPGVGPKTAAKLIAQYGSAEAAIDHADELSPKLAERLKAFRDQLPTTRKLVTLRRDVPLDFNLEACSRDRWTPDAVKPIFQQLGFSKLVDSLSVMRGQNPGAVESSQDPDVVERGASPIARPQEMPVNYHLIDTVEKLREFAGKLRGQRALAFDTETTGLCAVDARLVGISISWKAGEAYYIPTRGMGATIPETIVAELLRGPFEDPAVAKYGHNLKFDVLVLRQIGIGVANVFFDTLVASFLLDPVGRAHSLDSLAKGLLGHDMIPITDLIGKGKKQISMDQVDTRHACEYACEDADYTWRIKEILEPRIASSQVESLFRETEMPLVEVLVEMENNGVSIDRELLKRLGNQMADRMQEIARQVQSYVGHPFNLDSPRQLATVLFDELKFDVLKSTKTGRSTDAETLELLAAQTDHPVPRLLLEHRELSKLKGTYVDSLPAQVCRKTNRIHASFHQTGAVTGRLSSSDPNLQNIPIRSDLGRQIRSAFVARDQEHVIFTADYSQIELRLLAHFSQDEALLEAFKSGLDIHRAVAAQVNAVSIDEVTPAQRNAAKAVNFGIIYGQTPFGLSRTLGISSSDAKAFIETYFRQYPGIRRFIDQCIFEARERGYAQTILGRRRPIPELQSRNRGEVAFGERIAVNTVVQGSAADLIKRAMINIHRQIKMGNLAAKMLIQVHDELVFEVPRNRLEEEATFIQELMKHALELSVPVEVDTGWGDSWSK